MKALLIILRVKFIHHLLIGLIVLTVVALSGSCKYGANTNSVFDRTGTVGLYSFRYAFMSYLYHISSGTKAQREDFVYKVTTGKDRNGGEATRAKNAVDLFTSFKSASEYDRQYFRFGI